MRDKLIDLIRQHEDAHLKHSNAVKDHREFNNEATKEGVFQTGSLASATGSRLEGFVEGIFAVATYRKEDQ